MKKFLIFFTIIVMVTSTAFFCFAETEIPTQTEVIAKKGGSPTPVSFKDQTGPFAILTPVIPENKAMLKFIIEGAPTWNNQAGNSDADVSVFVWRGDYGTTTAVDPIYTSEVKDHKDNMSLTLELGLSCFAGNRYLILITLPDGGGNLGYYSADEEELENWAFFTDGDESDYPIPGFDVVWGDVDESMRPESSEIVVIATPEPTAEPTAAPTANPTAEPTAEATQAPKNEGGCGGAIGGGLVIVALAAAVAFRKKEN